MFGAAPGSPPPTTGNENGGHRDNGWPTPLSKEAIAAGLTHLTPEVKTLQPCPIWKGAFDEVKVTADKSIWVRTANATRIYKEAMLLLRLPSNTYKLRDLRRGLDPRDKKLQQHA